MAMSCTLICTLQSVRRFRVEGLVVEGLVLERVVEGLV